MPNATSLTLPHGSISDISADEVYDMVDRREGTAIFRHVGDKPMALADRITIAVKQPNVNSKYWRVVVTVVRPESYTDTDTSLVNQQLVNRAQFEFQIDKTATAAQAKACTERALAVLSLTDVQTAINNCENFY